MILKQRTPGPRRTADGGRRNSFEATGRPWRRDNAWRLRLYVEGRVERLSATLGDRPLGGFAHQHIHLYGHYPFDLASRPDGHRPLRAATPSAPAPETLNRV